MQRADLGVLLTVQETMKHRPVLRCGRFSTKQKTVHWFQEQCSADCRVNVINYSPGPLVILYLRYFHISLKHLNTVQTLNTVDGDAFLKLAIATASPSYCTDSFRLSICNRGEDFSLE